MSALRLLTLLGATVAFSSAQAQFVAMTFSDVDDANTDYSPVGSFFNGTFTAGTLVLGDGVTAAGLYYRVALGSSTIDLSTSLGGDIRLASSLNAGNEAEGFDVILDFADTGSTNYAYYYYVSAAELSTNGITTVTVGNIGNPDRVLDVANGYAFVGSGPAFAPTPIQLSQTKGIFVQGAGYDGSLQLRATLDQLTIDAVPEPATIAALGLGVAALMRRRRA